MGYLEQKEKGCVIFDTLSPRSPLQNRTFSIRGSNVTATWRQRDSNVTLILFLFATFYTLSIVSATIRLSEKTLSIVSSYAHADAGSGNGLVPAMSAGASLRFHSKPQEVSMSAMLVSAKRGDLLIGFE